MTLYGIYGKNNELYIYMENTVVEACIKECKFYHCRGRIEDKKMHSGKAGIDKSFAFMHMEFQCTWPQFRFLCTHNEVEKGYYVIHCDEEHSTVKFCLSHHDVVALNDMNAYVHLRAYTEYYMMTYDQLESWHRDLDNVTEPHRYQDRDFYYSLIKYAQDLLKSDLRITVLRKVVTITSELVV